MNLKQQLIDKNIFLRKAYEVAYEYAPSSPLSVSLNPIEFGKSIGFDETQTKRIMTELVADRYVQSSLGMGMLLVTRLGLEYLREIEDETQNSNISPMKEKLLETLKNQKQTGDNFLVKIEGISSSKELDEFLVEYEDWNKNNCEIFDKAYVNKQLFRMYSGVKYLDNVYVDSNSFQAKREKVRYCLPRQLGHLNTAIAATQDMRNIDLLPFDEQIRAIDLKQTKTMNKLFISHSSEDAGKIKPLIDLIEGVGVPPNQIFFSSHPAYGVSLGENIFERLKTELEGNVFALFILSDNFYKSPVCLCEMGAVWIKSNKQIPILIPPFGFGDVKGVFPHSLGFKMDDKDQLNSFKGALENYFGLTPIHITRWEEKREEYLLKVKALLV